jgi:hypothetical protein
MTFREKAMHAPLFEGRMTFSTRPVMDNPGELLTLYLFILPEFLLIYCLGSPSKKDVLPAAMFMKSPSKASWTVSLISLIWSNIYACCKGKFKLRR